MSKFNILSHTSSYTPTFSQEVNPRFEAQDSTSATRVVYDKFDMQRKEVYDPAKYTDPPKLLTEPPILSTTSLDLSSFAFSAEQRGAAPLAPGSSPGPRIKTAYERRRENEHLRSSNLSQRLKRGLVTAPAPAYVSISDKFFSQVKKDKKPQLATEHCVRLAERELYRQLLQSKVGSILPPLASTIRSPMTTKRSALFPVRTSPKSPSIDSPPQLLESPQPRPLTSTVVSDHDDQIS